LLKEALALEQRPTNQGRDARLPALLGETYIQLGKDKAAEPYLNGAIALYRASNAQARGLLAPLRLLGDVQRRRGDYPAATKHYRDAYNLARVQFPSAPQVLLRDADNLTSVLLEQKQIKQAEQVWRDTAAHVKRNKGRAATLAECLKSLALLRLASGNEAGYRDACRELTAFADSPLRAAIWAWSLAPHKADDLQPILTMARKSLGDSNNASDRALLGALLHRAGNSREALKYLQSSSKQPSIWQSCFLALAYRALDEKGKADEHLQAAFRTTTAHWRARLVCELLCREAGKG